MLNSKDFESHNLGAGHILSDILEENVPEKYYLSQKQTERLLYKSLEANREAASMTAGDSSQTLMAEGGGFWRQNWLYTVGISRKEGITRAN